jgi:hypothetical protein
MEKNANNLKPEELFGGFSSDYSETFLPESEKMKEAEKTHEEFFKANLSEEPKLVSSDNSEKAETIAQHQPAYDSQPSKIVVDKSKPGKSTYWGAVATVLLILTGVIYLIYSSISLPFLNKSGMTEIATEVTVDDTKIESENEPGEIIEPQPESINQTQPDAGVNANNSEQMPATSMNVQVEKSDNLVTKDFIREHPEKSVNKDYPEKREFPSKPTFKPEPVRVKPESVVNQRIPDNTQNDVIPEKPSTSTQGIYALEVYTTPSYDDAKEWINKLGKRKMSASIIPQKVRDKIVYKVRLGNFSSEEEARKTAINMGFSRSYIDRIR